MYIHPYKYKIYFFEEYSSAKCISAWQSSRFMIKPSPIYCAPLSAHVPCQVLSGKL